MPPHRRELALETADHGRLAHDQERHREAFLVHRDKNQLAVDDDHAMPDPRRHADLRARRDELCQVPQHFRGPGGIGLIQAADAHPAPQGTDVLVP